MILCKSESEKKPNFILILTTLLLVLNVGLAWSYSSSPPNGRTNAPGESNCTACHSSFGLNSGSGTLAVAGLSEVYEPGMTYDLIVSLDDPVASRWGFEFTILGESDQEIGTMVSLDGRTQVSSTATRSYAKQTLSGTQNGLSGGVTWNIRWTAPAAGTGAATIYLVGNAANGNFSTSGDRIYAISETWAENSISATLVPALATADLKPNFPNPFNPRTTIVYELAKPQSVRLSIYALDGKLVRLLEDGFRAEGRYELVWNGLNQGGRAVPSGTYFYRLQTRGGDLTRSMVLVR